MNKELLKELSERISVTRLAKTGLFQKIGTEQEVIRKELKLHRAVLDKALFDYFSDVPEVKKDVDDWLFLENPDFIEACNRAMLDPELVYKTFMTFIEIIQQEPND